MKKENRQKHTRILSNVKYLKLTAIYKYYVCYLLKLNNLLINDMNLAFNRPKPQQHVP